MAPRKKPTTPTSDQPANAIASKLKITTSGRVRMNVLGALQNTALNFKNAATMGPIWAAMEGKWDFFDMIDPVYRLDASDADEREKARDHEREVRKRSREDYTIELSIPDTMELVKFLDKHLKQTEPPPGSRVDSRWKGLHAIRMREYHDHLEEILKGE